MGSLDKSSSELRKLALVIGNDDYKQSNNKLNQSVKNANELSRLLESIEFEVTTQINVNKEIVQQIITFGEKYKLKDNDLVLFYFSGHACQINEKNWLIPTDDSRITTIDDVEAFGTNVNQILKRLLGPENSSCTVICILDCCKPYNLEKNSAPDMKGLLEEKPRSRVFIQYACAASNTTNNNLFAKHLLRRIVTPNKDIVEVFREISDDVYAESNRTQMPLSINGLDSSKKVYLYEKSTLPEIPANATWKEKALSVVGHKGSGKTLDRLNSPKGLCIDKNQDILIVDSSNHRIIRCVQSRSSSSRPTTGKSTSSYTLDMLYKPIGMTLTIDQENIIVSDCHNLRMLKNTLSKTNFKTIVLKSFSCFALAMADDGTLYVSDTKLHEVRRYKPGEEDGTVVAGGNGPGRRLNQLNHPTYIFIGKHQSIYISDSLNDRVMRWDEGAKTGVIVAGGHGKGKNRNQLDYPTGLFVDSLSTVYVADSYNGRVMRWRKDAPYGDIIAGDRFRIGDSPEQLNGPEGIAVDQNNNLYVADSNNHRIQRFEIEKT